MDPVFDPVPLQLCLMELPIEIEGQKCGKGVMNEGVKERYYKEATMLYVNKNNGLYL